MERPSLEPRPSSGAQISFLVDTQISSPRASDSPGSLAPERQKPRIGRLPRAHHGQWGRFEARKQPLFPGPLPVIGVRRGIMQCRAHDDDRAAPGATATPGPEIPMASAFQPPTPVFSLGDRIGGFVDSGPETLVPSASNRSTPEWTLADSKQNGAPQGPVSRVGAGGHTGMFCCATMQYSMPIENMVLKRLA